MLTLKIITAVADADRVAHASDFYALAHGVDPYDDDAETMGDG